ncbi:C4b-binding protein alpha chain isoform X10 [Gasterosteus aculeatus]
MDVTYVLLLSSLGLAQVIAQDCRVPVGGNNMGFKDDLPQTFPNGTKVIFECNVGYMPAGSPSITCTNGTWSPVKLTCERKSCGSAGEVENGDLNYEGTEFGDKLVVTCKTGYIMVGNSQFTCGKDGWLGGRLPVCEAVACDAPPMLTNGDFSPVRDSYNYLEVVQYKCQKDYTMNGSSLSSCSKDGKFQPAPPTCIVVQCKDPDVTNGEWMSGSRPPYKYKSAVTLQCIPGYNMNGAQTQRCELNSQWAPGLPTCEPVLCEDPDVKNAAKEEGSKPPYKVKSTVTFSCVSGYTMTGTRTQTCGLNGQWAPGLPTCAPVLCEDPDVKNAAKEEGSKPPYKVKSTVTFSCVSGYTMTGTRTQTCGLNGQWAPGLPTCEPVLCEDPDVKNAAKEEGSKPPYKVKSTVTFSCVSGYTMTGTRTQTCGLNGQWAPGLPTCAPVLCEDPDVKNAAKEEGSKPPYKVKSTVTFSCVSGYTMTGTRTQTCGLNGQWAPGLPTCELTTTTKRPTTTKKTIGDSGTVDPPENKGNGMAIGLGLGLTVSVLLVQHYWL